MQHHINFTVVARNFDHISIHCNLQPANLQTTHPYLTPKQKLETSKNHKNREHPKKAKKPETE